MSSRGRTRQARSEFGGKRWGLSGAPRWDVYATRVYSVRPGFRHATHAGADRYDSRSTLNTQGSCGSPPSTDSAREWSECSTIGARARVSNY